MRFSLLSIIVLTFWIALGMQVYLGRQRLALAEVEEKKVQANTSDLQRRIRSMQSQDLEKRAAESTAELTELDELNQALVDSFNEEVESLSELTPHPKRLSIRTLPAMDRAQQTQQSVKVSIPPNRKIALQMFLQEEDTPLGSEDPNVSPPSLGESQIEGKYPITVPLAPGVHRIDCLYHYRDENARPYFYIKIDGEEVSRLLCPSDRNGYSSSRSNWLQQQDFAPKRNLPQLMSLNPGGIEAEIVVRLIDEVP